MSFNQQKIQAKIPTDVPLFPSQTRFRNQIFLHSETMIIYYIKGWTGRCIRNRRLAPETINQQVIIILISKLIDNTNEHVYHPEKFYLFDLI
jgi:hypothetical protein